MSATSSPRKLGKKQSLSILSSSSLNQINNQINNESVKPTKERIISESTGLIKFSIKKPETQDTEIQENKENKFQQCSNLYEVKEIKQDGNDSEQGLKKMPIYIPINCDDTTNSEVNTQELLFRLATQQRKVLDLTEQLHQAKDELSEIEEQCKSITYSFQKENSQENATTNMIASNKVTFSLKKSTSLINLNTPKINAQQQISKTQKQMAETFNQITNNLSNINIPNINISNNDFLLKGRNFFETNLNKNIQMGSGLFNSIFSNEKKIDSENEDVSIKNEDVSIENENQNYEYSVDFDLDRLNKKIRGTILQDLDEEDNVDLIQHNKCSKTLSAISDISEDYGGDAVNM